MYEKSSCPSSNVPEFSFIGVFTLLLHEGLAKFTEHYD
jgi:hypothetical protein